MFDRVRSFLQSLQLRPEVEGRSADAQHAGALKRHRSIIQNPERANPMHPLGRWTTRWDGGGQPQNLPDRPPLLHQAPTIGAHEAPFVGDRIPPAGWDGETTYGATNVQE